MKTFLEKYQENGMILTPMQEVEYDPQTKLFREVVQKLTGSNPIIAVFDHWVEKLMLEQVESQSFTAEDGTRIVLTKPDGDIPMLSKPVQTSPRRCIENKVPYMGVFSINCKIYDKDGKLQNSTNVNIGQIPIMTGSIKCHLRGLSKEELAQRGECIADPFGYFVIKTKRSIITQERLRSSLVLIYNEAKTGKIILIYTSNTFKDSKILSLTTGTRRKTIKIGHLKNIRKGETTQTSEKTSKVKIRSFYYSKFKTFPSFLVFKLLSDFSMDEIIERYILPYIPDQRFENIILDGLHLSIIKAKEIDPIEYIARKRETKLTVSNRKELEKEYRNRLISDLFLDITSSLPDDPSLDPAENEKRRMKDEVDLKLHQLGRIIVHYIFALQGLIPKNSRDSWANKKFDGGGRSMMVLFRGLLEKTIREAKSESNGNYIDFANSLRKHGEKIIKKEFISSFNNKWGVDGSYVKENLTEVTKDSTPIDSFAQNAKNNTPQSRKSKISGARAVQPSQANRHCPSETPENESNGLIKFNASTFTPSLDEPRSIIENIIRGNYINEDGTVGNLIGMKKSFANDYLIIINGFPVKNFEGDILFSERKLEEYIKLLRRNKIKGVTISPFTEVFTDEIVKTIEIYCDASRPCCPFLIVNQQTNKLYVEELGWELGLEKLLELGAIEYIASREEENDWFVLAYNYNHFNETKDRVKYSHCVIDPMQMLSLSTTLAPMPNHQPGPRVTYQSSMSKQALPLFTHFNFHYNFPPEFKQLLNATRPLTETSTYFIPMLDVIPNTQTLNVAFMSDPDNQEDAVVVSEDFVNSGMFTYIRYVVNTYVQEKVEEEFKKPTPRGKETSARYDAIGEDGYPVLDKMIKQGDCILGKINVDGKNTSIFAGVKEDGIVDSVKITNDSETQSLKILTKLRRTKSYMAGDKEAFRYSQKGTIGRIAKSSELPIVIEGPNKGMRPDLMFNPHGFPSRQTIGLIIEGIFSKAACYDGKRRDVSAFTDILGKLEEAQKVLESEGFDRNGEEKFMLPGGKEVSLVFVPLADQILRHQVLDKIQARTEGMKDIRYRQPVRGRKQGGGQRNGEMERDAFASHGASGVLQERMMKVSDEFKVVICSTCGVILPTGTSGEYVCKVCKKAKPGILTMPYPFKVLLHYLNGMGIEYRLNTELIEKN